jgi:parallel beta-helix repeat protein
MRREGRLFTEGYREMKSKAVSGIMLTLLLISMLTLAFNVQPVEASGTIYIRADGSIDPSTANITSVDNVTYYFTDNIYDEIVVQRSNITMDGNRYTLQGYGSGKGFGLTGINNVTIKNTNIKGFWTGIYLNSTSSTAISGNNITNNGYGIRFSYSSDNSISGNNITNNGYGIRFSYSSSNTISGNNITENGGAGIWLSYSSDNSISGNNITNNDYGIPLYYSSNNTLRNNDASNNKYHFGVYGWLLSHYIQDIDDSNTVNGKPVYYWVNRRDVAVPLDAGYVALVNCTSMTVQNLNLTNNGQGVLLASTKNSTITKNNITNNGYGIRFSYSSSNTISGNNITNNGYGIWLSYSSSNTISGNNTTANNWAGIGLPGSNYNTISENSITTNEYGIYLDESSNNKIYHNNFIDNTNQTVVQDVCTNIWDDGYPSGGNYWSDHVCSGNPSDGSQPYIIDANNIDHYPFQDPNGWLLHQLTVTSSPIAGITFTVDGVPQTTPYTEWLLEGSYTLIMPETHNRYVWSHWLEDGDTNRIKTILLQGTTWTAVYESAPKPVGGKATPIYDITFEPELQPLWIWLSTIILSLAVAVVYVTKRKKHTQINYQTNNQSAPTALR